MQTQWNATVASWTTQKKSFMSIPPLLDHNSSISDDGIVSQSQFAVSILEEEYLENIQPNVDLVFDYDGPNGLEEGIVLPLTANFFWPSN